MKLRIGISFIMTAYNHKLATFQMNLKHIKTSSITFPPYIFVYPISIYFSLPLFPSLVLLSSFGALLHGWGSGSFHKNISPYRSSCLWLLFGMLGFSTRQYLKKMPPQGRVSFCASSPISSSSHWWEASLEDFWWIILMEIGQ